MFTRLMFIRISPQKAQHRSGFIVQVGSRYSVQYMPGDLTAEVSADFAAVTGIYPETLTLSRTDGCSMTPTAEDRKMIIKRIKNGLEFLGMRCELCEGHS